MVARAIHIPLIAVFVATFFVAIMSHAQSTLNFNNAAIEAGATTELILVADIGEDAAFGVNVAFDLPAGITLVDIAPGIVSASDIAMDFYVATSDGVDNVRALAHSTTASIEDGAGIVLRVTLQATDDLSIFGISASETFDVPIQLTASGLVGSDLQNSVVHSNVASVLTIKGPDAGPEGDVDGDGNVSAVDVQLVINAVLAGGNSNPANDLNGDGSVDAVDIQLVINLALGIGKDRVPAPVHIVEPDQSLKLVRVLPLLPTVDGAIPIGVDDYLYIRLRGDSAIRPNSVTGVAVSSGRSSSDIGWLPISPHDGWAVFAPAHPWIENEVVEFHATASTHRGESIRSKTYRFRAASASDESATIPQPHVYEGNRPEADGFVELRTLGPEADIEKLSNAITPSFYAAPGQVFSTPQRLWIPIPETVDEQSISLYVYLPEAVEKKWHPAPSIKAFLAEAEATIFDYEGRRYYGVLINFGAVVAIAE